MVEINSRKKIAVSDEQIAAFYSANLPQLLPNSNWRQYRLQLRDGTIVKLERRINTPEQLQSMCKKLLPVAVFQTVSCWRHPESLTNKGKCNKGGYTYLNNSFLYSDALFDLDAAHCTKQNLAGFLSLYKEYTGEKRIVRTGNGWHFWFHNFYRYGHPGTDPLRAESKAQSAMKKYADTLTKQGLQFDYPISIDTRRIARVPNTLHQNGRTIRTVSEEIAETMFNSMQ